MAAKFALPRSRVGAVKAPASASDGRPSGDRRNGGASEKFGILAEVPSNSEVQTFPYRAPQGRFPGLVRVTGDERAKPP